MIHRTRLPFFVLQTAAGWIVRVDGFVYPPCTSLKDALSMALREARAAKRLGFASVVMAQAGAGRDCRVCWTFDADPAGTATAIPSRLLYSAVPKSRPGINKPTMEH